MTKNLKIIELEDFEQHIFEYQDNDPFNIFLSMNGNYELLDLKINLEIDKNIELIQDLITESINNLIQNIKYERSKYKF